MSKRVSPTRLLGVGSVVAAVALALCAPVAAGMSSGGSHSQAVLGLRPGTAVPARDVQAGPARIQVPRHPLSIGPMANVKTTNWAGYVDKGHTFSVIRGSWAVPHVTCTSTDSATSFWVGMDGYLNKNVEQAGTLAYCHQHKVTYYTWWQMYPATDAHLIGSAVQPGDHVTASVAVAGHTYTLRVMDHTAPRNSFTQRTTCVTCRHDSVEWIAERPRSPHGLYPLAKFGELQFYGSRVGVGTARGSIGHYAHDAITMINHNGDTMARVSTLQQKGNRFVATWLRAQ